jgi:hypothetical protein
MIPFNCSCIPSAAEGTRTCWPSLAAMTEPQPERPLTEPDAALTATLASLNDAALTEPDAALTEPRSADRASANAPRCCLVVVSCKNKKKVIIIIIVRPARRFFHLSGRRRRGRCWCRRRHRDKRGWDQACFEALGEESRREEGS